jgi:hypothetical protein
MPSGALDLSGTVSLAHPAYTHQISDMIETGTIDDYYSEAMGVVSEQADAEP